MSNKGYSPADLWDNPGSGVQLAIRRHYERMEAAIRSWPRCSRCQRPTPRPPERLIAEYWQVRIEQMGSMVGYNPGLSPVDYTVRFPDVREMLCSDCAGSHPDPWWWRV